MIKNRQNFPIYVLSASLVFFGVAISVNGATAAPATDPKLVKLQRDYSNLQRDYSNFKECANSNFTNITFFTFDGNVKQLFMRNCR